MSRHYELVLMLDPELPEERRNKLVDDVRTQIEAGGTLDAADDWGTRKMAYEIKQRNEADYRFFRFQGENQLLESLDHNLKIVDGALRFRIFKVEPDAPTAAPPVGAQAAGSDRPERPDRSERTAPRRRPRPPCPQNRVPRRQNRRPPPQKRRPRPQKRRPSRPRPGPAPRRSGDPGQVRAWCNVASCDVFLPKGGERWPCVFLDWLSERIG